MKFTFLLGAGASYYVLPTVEDIQKRLSRLLANYETIQSKRGHIKNKDFVDSVSWLTSYLTQFKSPDTLAKILWLRGDKDALRNYKKVKDVLTVFFYFEEHLNTIGINIDPRYIHFFASLMQSNVTFPKNVKILSWNYDFQVELAANTIRADTSVQMGSRRTAPLLEYFPTTSRSTNTFRQDYDLIHLNGCSVIQNDKDGLVKSLFHAKEKIWVDELWNELSLTDANNYIRFAWEGDVNPISLVEQHLAETEILIVIGYSFPFFNRDTDKAIFKHLTRRRKLKKIYFQNPTLNGEFIYSQFDLPRKSKIRNAINSFSFLPSSNGVVMEHIAKTDQFHIPVEF